MTAADQSAPAEVGTFQKHKREFFSRTSNQKDNGMESALVTPIRRRTFIQLATAAGFGLASGIGGPRAFGIVKHRNDDALLDERSAGSAATQAPRVQNR